MYKLRSKWRFTSLILLLWGFYCTITLLTPQEKTTSKYHISPIAFSVVTVSVLLPYLVCWLYGVSAWLHLKAFTRNLPPSTERSGFAKMAVGLLLLVMSLIVPTLVGGVYMYATHNTSGPGWSIFSNYMGIFFPLAGSFLMYLGSAQVGEHIQPKVTRLAKVTTVLFPVVLFSVFYLFMIFTNPTRQTSADPTVMPTYFLPDSMIITTIVVPVIATWWFGLLLVLNLEHYSHYSKIINRPALVGFYNGIVVLMGVIILTQVLASLGSNRLNSLSLGFALALIYVLLGLITFGFGLLANGAKKLRPLRQDAKPG